MFVFVFFFFLFFFFLCLSFSFFLFFFFFQAEDGIRDHCVTGVQTCALPISPGKIAAEDGAARPARCRQISSIWAVSRHRLGCFFSRVEGLPKGGRRTAQCFSFGRTIESR